ncbi:MAG: radical SAM protein [Rhodospirillales bacterium CG15_BIG_FIL_POST_REV_8_21_14_020_66_15]|nr:MAG: radical SAM protein [Rhodospirillales bacterium CG15_BIG_FIL_POST_REV_8_21_14_020_66_15]
MVHAALAKRPAPDPRKFRDPRVTAKGEARAAVALTCLRTLWINTGSLCNIECVGCYIESGPRNDRLAYITRAEVSAFLDEIERDRLGTEEIGFTGGEPFMNRDMAAMAGDALARGFRVLILTNAMAPLWNNRQAVADLNRRHGGALSVRVSIDHFTPDGHEAVRGPGSWAPMMRGLQWLAAEGVSLSVAARQPLGETEAQTRAGFARLFASEDIALDARSPRDLVVFPDMDAAADVPEITEACWGILGVAPNSMMCATSRMVVKRKGAERPVVLPCTLLPYDFRFEMGATLAEAGGSVHLNHPHCATFCVLGGANCSGGA